MRSICWKLEEKTADVSDGDHYTSPKVKMTPFPLLVPNYIQQKYKQMRPQNNKRFSHADNKNNKDCTRTINSSINNSLLVY